MEGGLAMLAAGGLLLVTWLVSRVPVPRLEWSGWVSTVVTGVLRDQGVSMARGSGH